MITRLFAALVVLSLTVVSAQAEPKKLTPDNNWVGVISDNKKAKEAPKDGYITDAKTFEKLFKSYVPKEKLPTIDFKKKIVVVTLATGGPNRPNISATLDEGNLKILAFSTLIGGDGFGYSIAVFDKEGVKKVNGKEVK